MRRANRARLEPGHAIRAHAAPAGANRTTGRDVMLSRLVALLLGASQGGGDRPVVIASKPFAESYILAEMFAQLLEARGLRVDRRPGFGATEIAFAALRTDAIDVYPEYTGTGLTAILHEKPAVSAGEAFQRVSADFRSRYGIRWLAPLGFENTYAIAVRRATSDSLGLR